MNRFFSILTFLIFSATAPVITGCKTADTSETDNVTSPEVYTQVDSVPAQATRPAEASPLAVEDLSGNILENSFHILVVSRKRELG